jgi:hypothetical protein
MKNGVEDIKKHKWFGQKFDWEKLSTKTSTLEPPFKVPI